MGFSCFDEVMMTSNQDIIDESHFTYFTYQYHVQVLLLGIKPVKNYEYLCGFETSLATRKRPWK